MVRGQEFTGDAAPLVALLTDFGDAEYAGVMRGVLATLLPRGRVVDLSHQVSPHAVREGAWILLTSYRYFPPGTVFLAVVDPGVGSERRPVAVQSRRYRWVGPDNGLLHPAVQDDGPVGIVDLVVPDGASSTFHGRDLFAPAAARLAGGARLEDLGAPGAPLTPLRFHRRGLSGEVVHVDRFGNVVTSIRPPSGWAWGRRVWVIRKGPGGGRFAARWVRTYQDAGAGELVVLTGSAGTVEIATQNAPAAGRLGAVVGVRIALLARAEGELPGAEDEKESGEVQGP